MADSLLPRESLHSAPVLPPRLNVGGFPHVRVDALGLRLAEIAVAERGARARVRAMAACLAEGSGALVALYHVSGAVQVRLLAASTPRANGRTARALAERAARAKQLVVDQPSDQSSEAEGAPQAACALDVGEVVVVLRGTTSASTLGALLIRLAPVLRLVLAQPTTTRARRSPRHTQEPHAATPAHAVLAPPADAGTRDERTEEHLEERQRLLSLASHDLRTPLNTLTGFLEIVHDEMVGPLNAKQKEFLGYARSSVQQVALLFENVLTLSQGARAPIIVSLPLGELLGEAIQSVMPMAEAARVSLRLEPACDGASLPTVLAEREALLSALRQVLANALLVTPAKGCVHVGAAPASAERAAVRCTITDAGPPLCDEDCAALLEEQPPREQMIEGPRGTGGYRLRLAIARLEVERLGGSLTLTPSKRGLAVSLTLPAA